MSNPSIKAPSSPQIQPPGHDDNVNVPQTGEDGGVGGSHENAKNEAATTLHDNEERHYFPKMNYPMDENLFYSAPTDPPATEHVEEGIPYEEPASEDLVHPADFKPFFTLIEDPETGAHHHPTVHYMFSDDDPEILTSTVLETLSASRETSQGKQTSKESQERCVIVDMAADGKTVGSVASLSADWQALQVKISVAPSWGEESGQGDRGLMLKVSGQHGASGRMLRERKGRQGRSNNVDELVKAFGDRLEKLDTVFERG